MNQEIILNKDYEQYKNSLIYKEWQKISGFLELKKDNRFNEKCCYKDCKNNVFSLWVINELIRLNFPLMIKKEL